jgi:hypothetical protein
MGIINLNGSMQIKTLSCIRAGYLALLHASWLLSATGPDGKQL